MTEAQRDYLITELSLCSPTQIRKIVAEYMQLPTSNDNQFPFYDFLERKLEIGGYWEVGLDWFHPRYFADYEFVISAQFIAILIVLKAWLPSRGWTITLAQ